MSGIPHGLAPPLPGCAHSGILGRGIGYTLSPALQEVEARHLGLELRYDVLDTQELELATHQLPDLLKALRERGYAGINVTYPFKAEVIDALDTLDDLATTLGAVNTVVFAPDGTAHGTNTDVAGFGRGVDEGLPDADLAVVLQTGAGGAGAATAHALLSRGATRYGIADPDPARRRALVARLRSWFPAAEVVEVEQDAIAGFVARCTGVVNASPVGSVNLPGSPVPADAIHAGLWVADIVYAPLETPLLAAAYAAGAHTLDGGRMLVHQAAASFEMFHSLRPDPARMREHFLHLAGSVTTC